VTIKEEVILVQARFPARDQGLRPTCIAFTLAELNIDAATGAEALSPEYAYQGAASLIPSWVPGSGVPLDLALRAAYMGLPAELDFPYQAAEPSAPVPIPLTTFDLHGGGVAMLPLHTEIMCAMLHQGKPVGIGLRLTESFYMPVDGLVTFEATAILPQVLHAVALVGLGWENGELHFLIRNSWGCGWGQDGTAWASAAYLREHALCAFGA